MSTKTQRISLTVIRIILGILFLLSGIGKLISSGNARYLVELMATKFYWLIEYVGPIVLAFTSFELLLGVLLLWGRKVRWTLSAALALILFFSGILSYFYVQGFHVKACGCFGAFELGGGLTTSLLKNLVLFIIIVAGLVLARPGKTAYSPSVSEPA
jgi:uncharacterized membrane protein YphA (DoxX/SURF4 family)